MLLLVAWFAMSNHCALGVLCGMPLTTVAETQKKCCSSHSNGGAEEREVPSGVCCKTLRALPTEVGAKVLKMLDTPLLAELVWPAFEEEDAVANAARLFPRDAEPPGVRSFAEIVLQRSVLSHAPPLVV